MAQRDVSYLLLSAFEEEDTYSAVLDAHADAGLPCPTFEVWRRERLVRIAEAELNDGLHEPSITDPDITF